MPNPKGSFIWYELMTPDPAAAKRFYDAVVGWDIATDSVAPGIEYRMIGRSDGGDAGGVLTLTDEMRSNGARPIWLGYLSTRNVDASVEAIVADGGSTLMPPWDQPGVGRLAMVTDPDGAPFYLMDPIPPENDPNAASDAFSVDEPQHVRGMSSPQMIPITPSPFTASTSVGARKATWIWASSAPTPSSSTMV